MPAQEFALLELSAKLFRGLGDPTRLKILDILLEGEQSVSDLVRSLGIQQGRMSNHLVCLKSCGYVTTTSKGRYTVYCIADKLVRQILRLSREMIAKNAEHLWVCTRIPAMEGRLRYDRGVPMLGQHGPTDDNMKCCETNKEKATQHERRVKLKREN